MSTVLNNLRTHGSRTTTANGDKAYSTTLNKNLDFFFSSSLFRSSPEAAVLAFMQAYKEDPTMAIKNLFHLRNPRGGLGFRDPFRLILKELALGNIAPEGVEVAKHLLPYAVEYGRWDDVLGLIKLPKGNLVRDDLIAFVDAQLSSDIFNLGLGNPKNISLLAKWMPKINSVDPETRSIAYGWSNALFGGNNKDYRECLRDLRQHLNLVETQLVQKDYAIDYTKLPGRALARYSKAFMRHDKDGYTAYLDALKDARSKASEKLSQQTKLLYPYEIVRKIHRYATQEEIDFAEAAWASQLENKPALNGNVLAVYDGSGSMRDNIRGSSATCKEVAMSLALHTAERLTGPFKGKVITFSRAPHFIELDSVGSRLRDRLELLGDYNAAENTNLEALFDLVLEASRGAKEEDFIDTLLLVTDCEFDEVASYQGLLIPESTYQNAKRKFAEAGVPLPRVVYWNLNARRLVVPVSGPELEEDAVLLVSGFSTSILDIVSSGDFSHAAQLMEKALAPYEGVVEDLAL